MHLEDCSRTAIEPFPVWSGAVAWRPAQDQLVLLDPDGGLLEYSATGRYRRRVEPRVVYCTHGPKASLTAFMEEVRAMGFDARPLEPEAQQRLF